jgi:lipoate-protein ligase A
LEEKGARSIGERITTVRNVLSGEVSIQELSAILAEEFGRFFHCDLRHGGASDDELKLAFSLIERYGSEEWTFRR